MRQIAVLLIVFLVVSVSTVIIGQRLAQTNQIVAEEPISRIAEVKSGDGSVKLVSVIEEIDRQTTKYSLSVWRGNKKMGELWQTTMSEEKLTLPFNSWSPDNKQLFIRVGQDYYVFKADGKNFGNGKLYLKVAEAWAETKNANSIDHVSGWAGDDLLVVYTNRPGGEMGSKYWFVTTTAKFMPLAH